MPHHPKNEDLIRGLRQSANRATQADWKHAVDAVIRKARQDKSILLDVERELPSLRATFGNRDNGATLKALDQLASIVERLKAGQDVSLLVAG